MPVRVLQIAARSAEASELLYEAARITFPSLPSLEELRLANDLNSILGRRRTGGFHIGQKGRTVIIKTEGSQREVRLVWKGSRKRELRSVTITFVSQRPRLSIGSTHAAGEIIARLVPYDREDIIVDFVDLSGQRWIDIPQNYPGPVHPELMHAKWDDAWRATHWSIYQQTL